MEVHDRWPGVETVDRIVDVGQVVNVIDIWRSNVLEQPLPGRDLEPIGVIINGGEHAIRNSRSVLERWVDRNGGRHRVPTLIEPFDRLGEIQRLHIETFEEGAGV